MTHQTARKALDQKIASLPSLELLKRPHKGWIKAVREALGMSSTQLAKRLDVSIPRVSAIEKAEIEETLTIASLRRSAEALDCALVYSFVPKQSFEHTVKNRALRTAHKLISKVDNTMSLEAQNLGNTKFNEEIDHLADDIYRNNTKIIWDDVK